MQFLPRRLPFNSLLNNPTRLHTNTHRRTKEHKHMQHKLIRPTMINHEPRQARHNPPGNPFLLVRGFPKREDLDHDAAGGEVHGHLIPHLGVVFEGGVVDS